MSLPLYGIAGYKSVSITVLGPTPPKGIEVLTLNGSMPPHSVQSSTSSYVLATAFEDGYTERTKMMMMRETVAVIWNDLGFLGTYLANSISHKPQL